MSSLCRAITSRRSNYKVEFGSQCQNEASHVARGVGLCGTHFNMAFRKRIEVVSELPILEEGDMVT
jgi:hypothetical protein